ncbi:MAG: GNAT family N-acetyltransferase [Bacillota bacterium]
MYNIIEKSDKLIFRLTTEMDLDYVINNENAPENSPYVTQWTREQHLQAMMDSDIYHIIIADTNNFAVGYMIIAGLNDHNKSVELRRVVISEKGKGYGREALRLAKKHAFEKLNAHRVWLDVREHNIKAQELYKSEGFVVEGLIRECVYKDGKYISIYYMSILEQEYKSSH